MKEKLVPVISLIAIMLLLNYLSPRAIASEEIKAEIINYGLLKPITKESKVDSAKTTAGYRRVAMWKVTEKTDRIEAKLGTQFGIEFSVRGLPSRRVIILRKTVSHPMITKPDGEVSKGYSLKIPVPTTSEGTIRGVEGYGFDHEYELVPGEWTIRFWYKNRNLVEKTFFVYLSE